MKLLSLVAATLALVAAGASAQPSVEGLNLPAMSKHPLSMQRRDAILHHRHVGEPRVAKRHFKASKRTCKAKTSNVASGAGAKAAATSKQHSSSQSQANSQSQASSQSQSGSASHSNSNSNSASKSNSQSHASSSSKTDSSANANASSASSSSSSSSASGAGLFGFDASGCGSSGANDQQPNGSQNFLNCGLTSGGWKPPKINFDQLKIISATQAADSPVFAPCKDNLWAFQAAEKAHGIPATVLMSFAMQESTCNPSATGGNGEQGLMQITPDKCNGAPGGNCKEPGFNVDAGAKYFKSTLDQCGGSVLEAIGMYNGWSLGLTVQKATAAKNQGNCYAQNNLDYLYQMLNGWFLGKADTYSLGTYKNLASC